MRRIAVTPMARPIRARRSKSLGIAARVGEAGCSSRTAKKQAEKRNAPSPNASLAISTACARSALARVIGSPRAGRHRRGGCGSRERQARPDRPSVPLPVSSSFSALLEELRDQACPARLVACADTRSVVAVEILMKQHVIPEVRVALQLLLASEDGTAPALVAQEDGREAAGQLGCDFREVQ